MKKLLKRVVAGTAMLMLTYQATFATIPLDSFITINDDWQIFWWWKKHVPETWKFVSRFSKDWQVTKEYKSCEVNWWCFDPDHPWNANLTEDWMFFKDSTYWMQIFKCPAWTYWKTCQKWTQKWWDNMDDVVNVCKFKYEDNWKIKTFSWRPMDYYEWDSLWWDDANLKTHNYNLIKKYFKWKVQLWDWSVDTVDWGIVHLKHYATANDVICIKDTTKPLINLPKTQWTTYRYKSTFSDWSKFSPDNWIITETTATNKKIWKTYSLLNWWRAWETYVWYSIIDGYVLDDPVTEKFLADKGFNNVTKSEMKVVKTVKKGLKLRLYNDNEVGGWRKTRKYKRNICKDSLLRSRTPWKINIEYHGDSNILLPGRLPGRSTHYYRADNWTSGCANLTDKLER